MNFYIRVIDRFFKLTGIKKTLFFWAVNLGLKYSKNRAISYYKNENFKEALPFFNFIANYYPLEIGKYHAYLSVCYFKLNDFEKSHKHYLKAKSILKNDLKLIELDQFFLKNKGSK